MSGERRQGIGRVGRAAEGAAVLLLTGLGAWLRWRVLDQPIRYDEAVTWLRYVREPLATGVSLYDVPNNHVFHTLLAHLSTGLLGDGPRALRLPAFLAGTAVVPATWWLGRGAAGRGAALVGSAATAVSPALVLFSANARGYSLVVLAFVVLARLALDLRRRRSAGRLAAFAAVAALAGWTLPAALYPAVAAGAWLCVPAAPGEAARPTGERLRATVAAGGAAAAATVCLYLPVLRRSGLESLVGNRFVAPRGPLAAARELPTFLGDVAAQWAHGVPAALVVLLAAGAAAATVREVRRLRSGGRTGAPPDLFPTAAAASAVLLVAHGRVPFARVWLFLLPAFALFAGRGLEAAAARVAAATAGARARAVRVGLVGGTALAVAAGGAAATADGEAVRSWDLTGALPAGDRAARWLAERLEPGDVVRARLPSDAPLKYYFRRLGVPEGTVNGRPEPGGCIYRVANRRQEGDRPDPGRAGLPGAGPVLLRRFGPTEVLVHPGGPRADGRAPCVPAGTDGAGTGTTSRPRGGRAGERDRPSDPSSLPR